MIQNIELHRITPNPQNPRRTRSQESLQELADSILAQGLLHEEEKAKEDDEQDGEE